MPDLAKCMGLEVAIIAKVLGVSSPAKVMGLTFAAPFTPSGSPVGHWSADTITGLADGEPVATWPDQSGNGYDLVQAIAARKPIYKTDVKNGLPAVRFVDHILGILDCGTDYNTSHLTIHSIVSCSLASARYTWFGAQTGAAADPYKMIEFDIFTDQTPDFKPSVYIGNGVAYDQDRVLENLVDNTAKSITIRRDGLGVNVTSWFNGAAQTYDIGSNYDQSGNYDSWWIGGRAYATGSQPWVGDIFEIIMYDSALSTADREANEAGLNAKYAIY